MVSDGRGEEGGWREWRKLKGRREDGRKGWRGGEERIERDGWGKGVGRERDNDGKPS